MHTSHIREGKKGVVSESMSHLVGENADDDHTIRLPRDRPKNDPKHIKIIPNSIRRLFYSFLVASSKSKFVYGFFMESTKWLLNKMWEESKTQLEQILSTLTLNISGLDHEFRCSAYAKGSHNC